MRASGYLKSQRSVERGGVTSRVKAGYVGSITVTSQERGAERGG